MGSDADMEDYGFEYSEEEPEEQDVDIENQDSPQLLMRTIQHSLTSVQRLQVVMNRILEEDGLLNRLAEEKQRAEVELQAKSKELRAMEVKKAELDAQADLMVSELCKLKAETYELQRKLNTEEKKSAGLVAELEAERKAREELLASTRAEVDAAFLEGVADAGRNYIDQIKKLSPKLFRLGCIAVLKEMGVQEDHPLYQNPPEFEQAAPDPSPCRNSCSPSSGNPC